MKTLDMADTYPPAESFEDDEPTVRTHVPNLFPKVIVSEDEGGFDLHGDRDTIPCAPPYPQPYDEARYPGVGILIALGMGLLFWGTIAYIIFH
jgi:hypothetical protein